MGKGVDFGVLYPALERFKDLKGLVVDVRPNSGGDEEIAREFAACFMAADAGPIVYSRHKVRDASKPVGDPEAFGPVVDRVIRPAPPSPDQPRYAGKVAVLMGPQNMSSCESFLLMMRHGAGAKLIGEKSYGSSGNPRPVEIGCGITALIPTWIDLTPEGREVEGPGGGIEPDIRVEWKPTKEHPDPVLEAAVKWLRE